MNTIIKLDTNNLLYEFIQSESRVELNSMYRSSYFFCLLILLIPKLFILTMIHNRTNLMTTNTQIIIFNIYCLTDLIFLVICFALIVFFKEKTKYDYRIIKFFKFYFPISANFLVLSNYFIPIDKTEGIMYTNLICLSIFIINCLTIQIIQKNMIYSNTDLIINFFFYLKLNIIFFVFAGENRSFIIEVIKIIYYLLLLIIIKHYSEINNKVKLLESSNQSFYKLFLLLNNNLFNKTIIYNKDPEILNTNL